MIISTLRQAHVDLGTGTGLHPFIVAALCSGDAHGIYAVGACRIILFQYGSWPGLSPSLASQQQKVLCSITPLRTSVKKSLQCQESQSCTCHAAHT